MSRIDEKSDVTEDSDEEEWFGYVNVTYTNGDPDTVEPVELKDTASGQEVEVLEGDHTQQVDEPIARSRMRRTLHHEKKSVEVTHDQDVGLAATDFHADEDQGTGHVSAVDDTDSQVASEVTSQDVVEEVDSGGESCGKTGLMSVEGEDVEVGTGVQ